jgi:hypothetical protein
MRTSSCIIGVYETSQEKVVNVLRTLYPKSDAFVSPRIGAWVTVHPADFSPPLDIFRDLCTTTRSISTATRSLSVALYCFIQYIGLWAFDSARKNAYLYLLDQSSPGNKYTDLDWLDSDWLVNDGYFKIAGITVKKLLVDRSFVSSGRYSELCWMLGISNGEFSYDALCRHWNFPHKRRVERFDEFVHVGEPDWRGLSWQHENRG